MEDTKNQQFPLEKDREWNEGKLETGQRKSLI
jgi:hypothetical protein